MMPRVADNLIFMITDKLTIETDRSRYHFKPSGYHPFKKPLICLTYHGIELRTVAVLLNLSVGLDCSSKTLKSVGDLKAGFRSNRLDSKL